MKLALLLFFPALLAAQITNYPQTGGGGATCGTPDCSVSGNLSVGGNATIGTTVPGGAPSGSIAVAGYLYAGASGSTGALKLSGATSGTVSLTVAAVAGTWTFQLPANAGTSGYVLQTDGAGVTSWVANSASVGIGSTITSATQGSVLYAGASGALSQDNSDLFYDDTNKRLTVGAGTKAVMLGYLVSGVTNYPGIWFGAAAASPTFANSAFQYDPSNGNAFNTPTGTSLRFRINNADIGILGTVASQLGTFSTFGKYLWLGILGGETTANASMYHDSSNTLINGPSGGTVGLQVANSYEFSCTASLCVSAQPLKSNGYQSSDGSAGVTGATCSSWKNGLCVAP